MKMVKAIGLAAILLFGLVSSISGLAAVLVIPSEEEVPDFSFDRMRRFALQDAVPSSNTTFGEIKIPDHPPLQIVSSDVAGFEHMAQSPYYKVFFEKTRVKMFVQDYWVELKLLDQELGEVKETESVVSENRLFVSEVFESVDVSFTVNTSLLTETLKLKESKDVNRLILNISWDGLTPVYKEDGSILFINDEEKEILEMLPPFMEDAAGATCEDLHYELIETETGYELHKVIDENGLKWLQQAVYPVVIDPSMQTFEDAWESSGLTPYGQYFQNLKEFVNPATGYLTITQNDLAIPGRGLDLTISRVHQTPAVFYGIEPYDYEAPPVNIGKGWQLDFPYIGDKYLHLWGGTVYKIEWDGSQFVNHVGAHFTLIKNGDNSYTLTTASGMVYEFSPTGKLTHIKDIDQNMITFGYSGGTLTTITDTIGRQVTLSYSGSYLHKILYNNCEIEYNYDEYGRLVWMDDFLDRRTSYSYYPYCTGCTFSYWLLSEIEYPTTGYTEYTYGCYPDGDYSRYAVTNQKVYETNQVRRAAFSYTGSFQGFSSSTMIVKNESDITKGSYDFTIGNYSLITGIEVKNASGTALRKYGYTYNSMRNITELSVYYDGSTLSYANYYGYDNWGNIIYIKNAEGHESFFSYANTSTSGYFIDNTGVVIKTFTNAFSGTVPSSVHTALLGAAEKQDSTFVREAYLTYDSEAHPTQTTNTFGNYTTWLTYSGTFNEKTGSTSFPIDLTGHTVTGNAVLVVSGQPSDNTYQETHSVNCPCGALCTWCPGYWSNKYYSVRWVDPFPPYGSGYSSVGPFTHHPTSLGYQNYTTNPAFIGSQCSQRCSTFSVTTYWKAYPVQVDYNIDGSAWETISTNLRNTSTKTVVSITGGSHTLNFSESSSYKTKFSWTLYVPVDNSPDTYTTTMQYDTYGNVTSITDADSNTLTFSYSSGYSYAYLTEIAAVVGNDTITEKATYDYYRGWITSIQQPKGVEAGSGYDYLYSYDALGRVVKKEFPLLNGQSQRSYLEAVYDDTNRTVAIIDQLRHYITRHYDKLGRLTNIKLYTGEYGSGTLYTTMSCTYRYDNLVETITDFGNDQTMYTYDFLGRIAQISYPDLSSVSYSYGDTNNKITFTNGRGYDITYWIDWLNRITKVEEEYATDTFAVTTYQYSEVGQLTSFTDAENHTTEYTYASLFGVTKTTYPDSEYEEYGYDNMGNVTSFTDCRGNQTLITYDDIYRLTQVQYQDQSTVTLTYDLNSERTKMEDDAPNTGDYVEYVYDRWNRLTAKTRHISQDTYTVSYEYDVATRLISLTYPDDMEIIYSYDDLNRTTQVKRYIDGSNDEILLNNTQYTEESLLTQFDSGNGLATFYSYDNRDRVSTIDVKDGTNPLLDLEYTYDSNSNITEVVNGWRDTDSEWHSTTETYGYDGLDRLTSASSSLWSHTYSYDKVGNRTAKDGITYTINNVNQVTALSNGTTFSYDDNGNRTQKSDGSNTWTYTYDYRNRLQKVEKNGSIIGEYVYDGDGKRIQKTEDGNTTTYIYSGSNILYEETSAGTASYIYGPAGKIAKRTAMDGSNETYYYHLDRTKSTRLITDENKNIVAITTYHPYGAVNSEEGSESHLFTGKEQDATGLYYFGARYYDPEIGRFISKDRKASRISSPQTLNGYIYCANNPVKYIDPDGYDYFRPEWADHEGYDSGFDRSLRDILLFLRIRKLLNWIRDLIQFGQWKGDHEFAHFLLHFSFSSGLGTGASLGLFSLGIVGGIPATLIGLFIAFILAYVYFEFSEDAEFLRDLWNNDSKFRDLFTTAETYANLLAMGADCYQEAADAFVELYVYLLQQKYGDDWESHCDPDLLEYYKNMKKRKEEDPVPPETGGNYTPPPGIELD